MQTALKIALLICLLIRAFPVLAQDATEEISVPTPTPTENAITEGYVASWEAEVLFPQAIRFKFAVGRPLESLQSITLTVELGEGNTVVVPVDLVETVEVTDPYAEFVHIWELPRDNLPRLFSELTYQWTVVGTDGEIASVEDTITFTDPRATWIQSEDPQGFIDLTVPAGEINPQRLRRDVLLAYNLMAANTGHVQTFNILLYDDTLAPGCGFDSEDQPIASGLLSGVEIPCDPSLAEAVYQAGNYDVVQNRGTSIGSAEITLVEYFVSRFYGPGWTAKNVPDWFRVGLAEFYLPTSKTTLLAPVQLAARNRQLFSLEEMHSAPPLDSSDYDLWRAQSYGMVLYLADQLGVAKVFELANSVGSSESYDAAYAMVTRQQLSALLPNLERWLFTSAATSAYNFTAYQSSTATPTITRTPTPFPPTDTLTPTLTSTVTLTPTVTGVHSATPLPTRTIVPTATSAPPSVTPRPAGSLNTNAQTDAAQQTTNPLNFGIASLILLVVAIIGLVFLRWRRRSSVE